MRFPHTCAFRHGVPSAPWWDGRVTSKTDWQAWHEPYQDPSSALSERLHVVQRHIEMWLEATAPRPVTVVSSCAGDGRDLLGVLARRDDGDRITATLLDADAGNAERAREQVNGLGLPHITVRCTDAGVTDAYAGAVPADLVLLCGIFGNIADDDVRRTIAATPSLCKEAALVIWTRHRREPDLTPRIRTWFGEHGFEEVDFVAPTNRVYSVGVHRFTGNPEPLSSGRRLFTFTR